MRILPTPPPFSPLPTPTPTPQGYTLPTRSLIDQCFFTPPPGGIPTEPIIPLSAYSFSPPQEIITHTAPIGIEQWLPDNETLLITRRSLADQLVSVDLVNTTTGMVTQAIEPLKYLTEPRWLPMNDTVIWRSIGTLDNTVPGIWEPGYWARSFNPSWERQLSGRGNGASTAHDVSPDGKEFVFMSLPDGTQPLIWNQETHTLRDLPVDFAQWRYQKGIAYPLRPFYPLWHPDGDKILFHDGTWIILYDLTTNIGCDVNLMESADRNYYIRDAQWSPDGRYLLIKNSDSPRYTSTRGPVDMFLTLDTYTGEAVQHILGHSINSFSWAADNQTIAMVAKTEEEVNGIELFGFYLFNIYSSDTQRILPSFTAGSGIKWSSDGLRLALKCRDSLPSSVYVNKSETKK